MIKANLSQLSGVWGSEHYHFDDAFDLQALQAILSPALLNELIACDELETRRIDIADELAKSELEHGPFEIDLANLSNEKQAYLIQAVDHVVPELGQLLQEINFISNIFLDDIMLSISSQHGSVGPHFDQYHVLLLQVYGCKQWRLGRCDDDHSLISHDDIKLLQNFKQNAEFDCRPASMLYVPPGMPHYGVANDNFNLTLSIGFRAPSSEALLNRLLETQHQALRNDVIATPLSINNQSALASAQERIKDSAKLLDSSALLGMLSEHKYGNYFDFDESECTNELALKPTATLARAQGIRFVFDEPPQGQLFILGECFELSGNDTHTAHYLAANYIYSYEQLSTKTSPLMQAIVSSLYEQGFLVEVE